MFPILLLCVLYSFQMSEALRCVCAKEQAYVRSGPSIEHGIVGVLQHGNCLTNAGLSDTEDQWTKLHYLGKVAWISSRHLLTSNCSGSAVFEPLKELVNGCPRIISRREWGARPPKWPIGNMPAIPHYVFIHHGATPSCNNQVECSSLIRSYQRYHMDYHGWPDIGYSFVVGEDGNVYEARGWSEIGAHTYNYNYNSLGFCIMGNYENRLPNNAALSAIKKLIDCGLTLGKIPRNYVLRGHRDVNPTSCPGDKLYGLIKTWPHY